MHRLRIVRRSFRGIVRHPITGRFAWFGVMAGLYSLIPVPSSLFAQDRLHRDLPISPQQLTQQSSARKAESQPSRATVTLNLRNVTLQTALEAIRTQAKIELLYGDRVVPLQRRVSIVGKNMSVMDALRAVLRGTGVAIKVADDGQITLIKQETQGGKDGTRPAQPTRGALAGRVIDLAQKNPISQAIVSIEQLKLTATVDARGRYLLASIPTGTYKVSVRMLGYQTQVHEVTIKSSDTLAMDFVLTSVATRLTEVVTTGAGERQRYEVGNSIATINADSVLENNFVPTLSDLLVNRAPGVQVIHGSGAVGSAKRIRIRGIQSIVGSNDPIVLVDGIRINTDVGNCRAGMRGVGSNDADRSCADVTSRLDDIDPDLIESIDVLKGPAASTLYGSDAANGVIVIKTKRGKAGPARWRVRLDNGISYFNSKAFPVLTRSLGGNAQGPILPGQCGLVELAEGQCTYQDTIMQFSMFRHSATSPLATGRNTSAGVDVSGGTNTLQYFISGGYDDRLGNTKMPAVNVAIVERGKEGDPLPEYMRRPNAERKGNANIRVTGQIGTSADFSFGSELVVREQRRGNDGMNDAFSFRPPDDTITLSRGWSEFYMDRSENITRTVNSGTVNWRLQNWVSTRATYGFDFSNRDDKELTRKDACAPFCPYTWTALGEIAGGRGTTNTHTVDLGSTVTIPVSSQIQLRTVVGAQYNKSMTRDLYGYMADLAYGQTDFRDAIVLLQIPQPGVRNNKLGATTENRATAGLYLDQTIAFNNRLFIGGAVRQDMTSGLGPDGVKPVYPKFNVSWVTSEESFFPWRDWMNLRIRAAYGHAGVQPEMTTRLRTFQSGQDFLTVNGTFDRSATISGIGNQLVRPERTVEREYGFEVGILQDRFRLDVTRYHKNTEDALAPRTVAPSLGGRYNGSTTRIENIGDVKNTGTEIVVGARIFDRPSFSWNANVAYASRQNTLTRLDENLFGEFISLGFADSRIVKGYPLFGRWALPILSYGDENGDGLIGYSEVVIGDSLVYIGPSQPKYDISIQQSISLLNNRVQIDAGMQYQHGLVQVNQFLSQNAQALAFTQIKGAGTLKQQAIAVAANNRRPGGSTSYGFVERTNGLRFNTLGITTYLPNHVARMVRAQTASVGMLGTNLGLWTNYSGTDPETNTTNAGGNRLVDGGQIPQPRTWTLRVNLTF